MTLVSENGKKLRLKKGIRKFFSFFGYFFMGVFMFLLLCYMFFGAVGQSYLKDREAYKEMTGHDYPMVEPITRPEVAFP